MSQDLPNSEGKRIPSITFRAREKGQWLDLKSEDLFSGRRVIVFALPGAFTPTCSSKHLPRYDELAPVFRENGISDVFCVSVNDGFVMDAWKDNQKVENIRLIPDGNGELTSALGLLVDKAALGFGKRSWRYSMVVNDGVVEKMFIEPDKEGDPFEVSDADTMLNYINPEAKEREFYTLFTREGCPHCSRAKSLLKEKELQYEEILLGRDVTYRSIRAVSGASTVPQIFMNGEHMGSADDLEKRLSAS
ncbi:MAG: glutathione peroxidase [Planctomycetota bacterium]|nr:glutathione peroxidase [Planctomycetota bacterium]